MQDQKVYRVGILSGLDLFSGIADSFRSHLTELGYVEGENIIYEYRKTNFEPEKERQILEKFVADDVDLIFGFNTEVGIVAKEVAAGTGIPVIFANAVIEAYDLIDSVRKPGIGLTGVRYPGTDIAVRRLEVLHEIVPDAKRIWLPYQKDYPIVPSELAAIRPVATSLGITLIEFPAENIAGLDAELKKRAATGDLGFDAVLYIPESLSTKKETFATIAKYTRALKIPIGGSSASSDDYRTLFSVTIYSEEVGELAAQLAAKVLGGAEAGDLPVVSPKTRLTIYYKVAQELGLTIPEGVLGKADEIVR